MTTDGGSFMNRALSRFAPLFVLGALALVACSGEYSDYCGKKIDCEGGNDKDKSACNDSTEGQENSASDYGCGDQFDKLADCVKNNSSCNNKQYGLNSGSCVNETT